MRNVEDVGSGMVVVVQNSCGLVVILLEVRALLIMESFDLESGSKRNVEVMEIVTVDIEEVEMAPVLDSVATVVVDAVIVVFTSTQEGTNGSIVPTIDGLLEN